MDFANAKEYFHYDDKYFALICLLCKHAIRPTGMAKHLTHKHGDLSSDLRKKLSDWQASLPLVDDVRIPAPSDPPIYGLAIHSGFVCNDCNFIAGSIVTLKEHQRVTHNRSAKNPGDHTVTSTQTWFISDKIKLFQVTPCVPDNASNAPSQQSMIEDLLASQETKEREIIDEMMTLSQDQKVVDYSPWMARAKFVSTLAGHNALFLAEYTKSPEDNKTHLKLVWDSTGQMLEHCLDSVKDLMKRDWTTICFWMNGSEAGKPGTKPFSAIHRQSTTDKYFALWKRFICFCIRSFFNDNDTEVCFIY